MKIEIKHTSGKYEISLESITQICGENIKIKKFIVDSLDKYFGEKKYAEFEEAYINNILVDDLDVGRKYLDIYVVRSVEDIFNTLRLSKNSLMSKYLVQLISDYNMQAEINGIDEMLSDIFDIINQEINNKIGGVLLDYDTEDIFSMVNKTVIRNENGGFIENINNIELLISYLNILKEIWKIKPNKSLVIFDNIDHILNRQEYRQVLEMCNGITKMYDVNFCFLTSLSGYAVINENFIMGINIVNDDIVQMPSLEEVYEFLENQYPYKISIDSNLSESILKIINYIGDSEYLIDLKSEVILKILNKSQCIHTKTKNTLNPMENAFLMDKNMV